MQQVPAGFVFLLLRMHLILVRACRCFHSFVFVPISSSRTLTSIFGYAPTSIARV